MKISKSYTHLYQADIPAADVTVQEETAPATPPPTPTTPSFSDLDQSSQTPEASEPKQSIIPKLVIIGLIVLIIFLIYKLIPRSYEDCTSLPGSTVSGDTCTTFFRKSYLKQSSTQTPTQTPDNSLVFPSTTPRPASDSATYTTTTTKGGIPLETLVPTKPNSPKVNTPKPTAVNQNPVPTTAPNSDTAVPSDWVKHRYPDQKIAFWLPKGWTGSNAVYHTDTGITNLALGGPDSIKVTIMPNWNSVTGVQSGQTNYQVNGSIPAYKIVGDIYTNVYFEHNSQVYQFTCQNSLWSTCHIILQNIEFT